MSTEPHVDSLTGNVNVVFIFRSKTAPRARQAGVSATCTPAQSGEVWAIPVANLMQKPLPTSQLIPHGAENGDRRPRTVTAVAQSEDKKNWLLTCVVAETSLPTA